MADESNFPRVDFFPGFQVVERRRCVTGEVFCGGLVEIAGGLADAALVVAKNGNAFAREMIGED